MNESNENKARPLILEVTNFKNSLIACLNDALSKGIPCFIIEPILSTFLSEMKDGSQREYELAAKDVPAEISKVEENE